MHKIIKFLKEVRSEFKNIAWPKKDSLVQLTVVVIAISVVISLILGGFDYLFTSSFGFLANQKNTAPVQIETPTEITPQPSGTISPAPTLQTTPNSKK